jgi:CRISPR system Cascade subunit CasB
MDNKSQQTVLRWWQSMNLPPAELSGKHIQVAPTAYRAQLRRCDSIDAAMLTEGFRALWLKLDESITSGDYADKEIEIWAVIAATLVHVKKNTGQKLAFQAGRKADGDRPVVSELRFSQLQSARTPDEFMRRLRRIIIQINGEVSVEELGRDIQQWFYEHNMFRPRRAEKRIAVRWAMDYYRAASQKKIKSATK